MKRRFLALGKGLGYVGLYLGMQTLLSFPIAVIYGVIWGVQAGLSGSMPDPETLITDMMNAITAPLILISGALTLVLAFWLLKRRGRKLAAELSWNGFSPWLLMPLIFVGVSFNLAVQGVFSLLPESWMEAYGEASAALGTETDLWIVLSTVVMAPLVEEVIFRAAALSRLKRGFSWASAILIQAIVFGLCHGQWLWFLYTALLGVVMGAIWMCLRSTPATMVVHAAFNGFSMLLMWKPVEDLFSLISAEACIVFGSVMGILCLISIFACGANDGVQVPEGV